MTTKNLYNILGANVNSTKEEIRKLYLKKVKENRIKDSNTSAKEFEEIQEAYETLYDDEKRSYYDKFGQTSSQQQEQKYSNNNFGDFHQNDFFQHTNFGGFQQMGGINLFDLLFKQNFQAQTTEHKVKEINVKLNLKESLFGFQKNIVYNVEKICVSCYNQSKKSNNCALCLGKGKYITRENFMLTVNEYCFNCSMLVKEKGDEYIYENFFEISISRKDVLFKFNSESHFQINNSQCEFNKLTKTLVQNFTFKFGALNNNIILYLLNNKVIFLNKIININTLNKNDKKIFVLKNFKSFHYQLVIQII